MRKDVGWKDDFLVLIVDKNFPAIGKSKKTFLRLRLSFAGDDTFACTNEIMAQRLEGDIWQSFALVHCMGELLKGWIYVSENRIMPIVPTLIKRETTVYQDVVEGGRRVGIEKIVCSPKVSSCRGFSQS